MHHIKEMVCLNGKDAANFAICYMAGSGCSPFLYFRFDI